MKVNKFNLQWQIVRLQARELKDVELKIVHVIQFLQHNKNVHNYERVMNWCKMTALGYKKSGKDAKFAPMIETLLEYKKYYINNVEDTVEEWELTSTETLVALQKDLKKRTNNFMHGGKMPKDQEEFMAKLAVEIGHRVLTDGRTQELVEAQ